MFDHFRGIILVGLSTENLIKIYREILVLFILREIQDKLIFRSAIFFGFHRNKVYANSDLEQIEIRIRNYLHQITKSLNNKILNIGIKSLLGLIETNEGINNI